MPMPTEHYPPGWDEFSRTMRLARAQSRCECTGQCGLHQHPTHTRRCTELNHRPAHFANGRVVLTVAHLCQCDPICLNPTHVIAACQRCHLRIDRFKHARHRLENEKSGRNPALRARRAIRPPGTPPWPGSEDARGSHGHGTP